MIRSTSRRGRRRQAYSRPGRSKTGGFALVLVLCFVVLLTAVVVAFFSHALTQRLVSGSSAGETRANLFAQGAVDTIVGDLKQEIVDGSTATNITAGGVTSTIYAPTASAAGYYPTTVPYRAGSNAAWPNLVKRSAHDTAFHPTGSGYAQTGTIRAVNSTTTTPSLNGRYYTTARWNKALLLPPTSATNFAPYNSTVAFTPPDWVLVAQDGSDTHALTAPPAPSATNAIVGRYAYCIYDEGGLLDANVAGYPSTPANNNIAYKNAEAYADLTQLADASGNPYLTQAQIDQLVTWRNGATLQQAGGYASFVVTNPTGFLKTANTSLNNGQSDRMFASRQHLLDYLTNNLGSGLADDQLLKLDNVPQFLGTFTRGLNQPSYAPDGGKPTILAPSSGGNDSSGGDALINPAFLAVRVTTSFPRNDGTIALVGEPLVKKRFALNRLAWLTYQGESANRNLINPSPTGPDADVYTLKSIFGSAWLQQGIPINIQNYFGLVHATNGWTYVHGNASTKSINTLAQVAQLGREPDFIELLKAAVCAGSIAKAATMDKTSGTASYNQQFPTDNSVDYAVMQMTANIIDQFDVDGYPTTIYFANPGNTQQFVGVENLPYLNRVRGMVIKAAEAKMGATPATASTALVYTGAAENAQDNPVSVANADSAGKPLATTLQDTGVGVNMLYPELWNPHDWNPADVNRTLGYPRPLSFEITAQGDGPNPYFAFDAISSSNAAPGNASYTNPNSFDPATLVAQSPGFTTRGFSFRPPQRSLTELNTLMTFQLPSDASAAALFREPTLLFKPGVPGQISLAAPGLNSIMSAEHLSQFAAINGGIMSGVVDVNGYANGDAELQDPAAQGYIGFYLGAFPLRFVFPDKGGVDKNKNPDPGILGAPYNYAMRGAPNYLSTPNAVANPNPSIIYRVKCQDPTGTSWITYDQKYSTFYIQVNDDIMVADYKGFFNPASKNIGWYGTVDPRTSRFGMYYGEVYDSRAETYPPPFIPGNGDTVGWVSRSNATVAPERMGMTAGTSVVFNVANYGSNWQGWWQTTSIGWHPGYWSNISPITDTDEYGFRPGLLTQNNPGVINDERKYDGSGVEHYTPPQSGYSSSAPQYYADADGIVRRAMGALVPTGGTSATTTTGLPMATANTSAAARNTQSGSRPLILNRPFNSVADLGYVFSGTPWKNLDFFTPESGFAPLLDVFCINDTDDANGLVAGKVNLNTAQAPVLQAIIAGAYKDELTMSTTPSTIAGGSNALAQKVAQALVKRTTGTTGSLGPLRYPSELVGKWVSNVPVSSPGNGGIDGSKSYDGFSADLTNVLSDPNDLYVQRFREAALRSLANTGQTRTWNLLIDVVAQVGRYPQNSTSLGGFAVEGEQRYWVHLALDRYTGQVVAKQVEVVKE